MPTDQTKPLTECFLDAETNSLDTRTGDVIEVAWAINRGPIHSLVFPHTLAFADPVALKINGYFDRGLDRWCTDHGQIPRGSMDAAMTATPMDLIRDLTDATIVAENYGFDCAMLLRKLGFAPWHYRKVEMSSVAKTVFGLRHPEGLAETANRLRDRGYDIPVPDHTARADVAALRACYYALNTERSKMLISGEIGGAV